MSSTQQLLLGEGAGGSGPPIYIEDVFSCFLYTGTGATQTITNNIDLSTKGGLTWIKGRSGATGHRLTDTARGVTKSLASNSTDAEATESTGLTAFSTTGFTIGADADYNTSAATYVSWTFRKQAKFFDIVTYTGNGSTQTIAHNLGSVPGCIIVKNTSDSTNWPVYHRGCSGTGDTIILLNDTYIAQTNTAFNNALPTSTNFQVGNPSGTNGTNANGNTYVAYLFAHDAGGFGLTGTDNVISCGTYTTDGSGVATVSLGYEPQWVLTKATSGIYGETNWVIADNMRGMPAPPTTDGVGGLFPNTSGAEDNNFNRSVHPTSTGFVANQYASTPYIYIAIRRGPMKVPTVGTSVFSPNTSSGTTGTAITTGFPVDLSISQYRLGDPAFWGDRLRGVDTTTVGTSTPRLKSDGTGAETLSSFTRNWGSTGITISSNYSGLSTIYWNFRRAPSFFDEVCDTGTGVAKTVTHNLGVMPELVIRKSRSNTGPYWLVGSTYLSYANDEYLKLSTTGAISAGGGSYWNSTAPTSSVFSVGNNSYSNGNGYTFVTYLFATLAGISKVGSYTGNGSTQTIDCGFGAGGARFVLIKRTDSTGDWYVYDTARGMTVLTDPYLWLNDSVAEVATLGSVTTVSTGFALNAAITVAINTSSASYIFLAIA